MEEIKVKGIVIKSTDYKDSDKIVTIFSLEKGLIKARVRGVKKSGAKLSFAIQPFAFIEFVLISKNNFYTVINATSIDQFYTLSQDFDNYIFMMSCLEICEKTIKENDVNMTMFFNLLNSFKLIAYDKVKPINVFIKFMLETMRLLGYEIVTNKCSNCGCKIEFSNYFSFDFNGLLCSKCSSKNDFLELTDNEYKILTLINSSKFEDLKNLTFNLRNDLISVVKLLCKDFRIMTEEEITTINQYL